MSRRKRKKHGYKERLMYMHLLEDGRSIESIHKEYGINRAQLLVLWEKYQMCGPVGLEKGEKVRADFELKRSVVLDIEENHLTLHAASLKYGACPQIISAWLKTYRDEGLAALSITRKRGRPSGMGRPKKNIRPLTELERLRKENQELKTEIALLKKVRALVEERNARQREIGRGPSRD